MFEVNGTYANRKGNYTVISLDGTKMTVRYEDGSEASLNIGIQERIWENIDAERQAEAARNASRQKTTPTVNFYIKTITVTEEGDLVEIGLRQRISAALEETNLDRGDRLIYYAVEPRLFLAVATITSEPKKGKAHDYFFGTDPKAKVLVYPIDIDALIENADAAIPANAMELESLPNHHETLVEPYQYHPINEDDFELLAELIMEIGESDDALVDDDDIEPDDELLMEMDD